MLLRAIPGFAIVLAVAACGPSAVIPDTDAAPEVSCSGAGLRCYGSTYQQCVNGTYETLDDCSATEVCTVDLGCTACTPGIDTCVGDAVHACNGDGSVGAQVEVCEAGQCTYGHCSTGDGCTTAAELVYVVDMENEFYSFDPTTNTFASLGTLSCNAGADLYGGEASPFSMSVDRQARAWVLYTSGEIFHVTTDGETTCTRSDWTVGNGGFELFGMGFVTDEAGGTTEKLYINGGDALSAGSGSGDYGYIDPETFAVHDVGPLDGSYDNSPELTGTGNGELYAYFPVSPQVIVQIDKATGDEIASARWTMTGFGADVTVAAWAFAHWGGDFYAFVTTQDMWGDMTPQVYKLDPETGSSSKILSGTSVPVIVGAGVSTCAPVEID